MAAALQQFIVITIMRCDIADMLNDVITARSLSIPLFTQDDDRLTDEICQEAAGELGEVLDANLGEEDRGDEERSVMLILLEKHFK